MAHSNKLWRAVLAAFLAIPAPAFADNRAGGQLTVGDVTLNNAVDEPTDIWEVVMSEAINLTTQSNIIVTACSDVANPGGATANTYRFVIALDDTSPGLNTGSERTVDELFEFPNDLEIVHVCSTRFFGNVAPGAHTIYWLGSKADESMLDTIIEDTSMTIGAFNGSRL